MGTPRGCRETVLGCQRGIRGWGVRGVLRDWQGLYSGTRRGIGASGALGLLGGVGGVKGVLEWQVDWEPNHIGPQSRVPALPLVPLRE